MTLRHALASVLTVVLIFAGVPSFGASDEDPIWKEASSSAPMPDIAIESLDGNTRHLSDLRGRVVLLSFWATWCAPCIAELPTLIAVRSSLGEDAISILAVSEDRGGKDEVEKFASHHPELASILTALDSGRRVAKALGIGAIPTTILIDRQGREVGRLIGGADWRAPHMRDRIAAAGVR